MTKNDTNDNNGPTNEAAAVARDERTIQTGETVEQDSIPDLPRNENLHTADEEVDNFQQLGQRKDQIEDMTRGTSDMPIAGEQYVGANDGELDSTNAVTAKARSILADREGTFTIPTGIPVAVMSDIEALLYEVLGTRNVKPGKMYTAIKSTVFKFPGGRGNRAAILKPDGNITFLSNGTNYSQWYNQLKKGGGIGLIVRYDQHLEAKNPFVEVDVYETKNLPAVAAESELSF